MKSDMKTPMADIIISNGSKGLSSKPALDEDVGDSVEDRVSSLEARPRVPGTGDGSEGDVLTLDADLRPRWDTGSGGLPDGTNDGDMLIWNDTSGEWEVFDESIDLIRMWQQSTSSWSNVEVPGEDDKYLRTRTGNPPLEFDYIRWR